MRAYNYVAAFTKNLQKLLVLDVTDTTLLSLWVGGQGEYAHGAIFLVPNGLVKKFEKEAKRLKLQTAALPSEAKAINMLKGFIDFR